MAMDLGIMKNHNLYRTWFYTVFYFLSALFFFVQTSLIGHGGGNHSAFNRVFRSLHAVPTMTDNAPTSYWTLDWLTHPMKMRHAHGNLLNHPKIVVDKALCLHDFDACLSSADTWVAPSIDAKCSASSPTIQFSCAPTRNQTRYAIDPEHTYWTEDNTCKSGKTAYDKAACQMQRTAEMSLLVNDDKTLSISSGHSQLVLLFYVSLILFTVNLFLLIDTNFKIPVKETKFFERTESKDMKKYAGLFVLAVAIVHRGFFIATDRWLGMDWPMPNGSFFYGILALVSVIWFGRNSKEGPDDDVPVAEEVKDKTPSVFNAEEPEFAKFNVSGFNGSKKIKTAAFMQPGKTIQTYNMVHHQIHTDLAWSQTIEDKDYKEPTMSLWALTQLLVWPLLLLSTVVVKNNFQLDIKITVVAVGMFLFGLVDLFGKRLLEHKALYKHVCDKLAHKDASMMYGVRVVYLVCLIVQFLLLFMVFNALGWSFWAWQKDHGVWFVGAPEIQMRQMITNLFRVMFLSYYFVTLLVKLGCLLPEYSSKGDTYWMSKMFADTFNYTKLDDICFFMLNLFVGIFVAVAYVHAFHLETTKAFIYYENGVYLKQLAAGV